MKKILLIGISLVIGLQLFHIDSKANCLLSLQKVVSIQDNIPWYQKIPPPDPHKDEYINEHDTGNNPIALMILMGLLLVVGSIIGIAKFVKGLIREEGVVSSVSHIHTVVSIIRHMVNKKKN